MTRTNWCFGVNIDIFMKYMYLIFIKAVWEKMSIEASDWVPFISVCWGFWQIFLY